MLKFILIFVCVFYAVYAIWLLKTGLSIKNAFIALHKYLMIKILNFGITILQHPLLSFGIIIFKGFSLIFSLLSHLCNNVALNIFYPFILLVVCSYFMLKHYSIPILLLIPLIIIYLLVLNRLDPILDKLTIPIWKTILKASKLFDNKFRNSFEKANNIQLSRKESPSEYAERIIQAQTQRIANRMNRVDPGNAKKVHIKTRIDILYRKELELFDLYMKDFTIEDLKRRKRELLKLHHSDQFLDPDIAQSHRQAYDEVIQAYEILEQELKKEA